MPEITVSMAAGRTDEQKAGMMRDITQALVKNLGVDAGCGRDPDQRSAAGPQDEGRQDVCGTGGCGKEIAARFTLPWRGRVGSHGAQRNARRGGGTVSPLGHC